MNQKSHRANSHSTLCQLVLVAEVLKCALVFCCSEKLTMVHGNISARFELRVVASIEITTGVVLSQWHTLTGYCKA